MMSALQQLSFLETNNGTLFQLCSFALQQFLFSNTHFSWYFVCKFPSSKWPLKVLITGTIPVRNVILFGIGFRTTSLRPNQRPSIIIFQKINAFVVRNTVTVENMKIKMFCVFLMWLVKFITFKKLLGKYSCTLRVILRPFIMSISYLDFGLFWVIFWELYFCSAFYCSFKTKFFPPNF